MRQGDKEDSQKNPEGWKANSKQSAADKITKRAIQSNLRGHS